MKKEVKFKYVKFTQDIIKKGLDKIDSFATIASCKKTNFITSVNLNNEIWEHDNLSEFFNDYNRNTTESTLTQLYEPHKFEFRLIFNIDNTFIRVQALDRSQIEEIHQIFSQNADKCKIPLSDQISVKRPIVFLGHGGSNHWRDLKDHLQDKHGYKIEAFEVGARAGHAIRDILDEMLLKSSMAFIVMTAEDEDINGNLHARENVIHELGLFQGKLGFHKAIAILEEGTNEFSNIHGIQQIRYSSGNIKEIFGEVLATLKREFN